jgi:hypothetical protein
VVQVTAFETVVSALEKHGSSINRVGSVPGHEDRTASLSISHGDRRALVNCHAGCDIDASSAS